MTRCSLCPALSHWGGRERRARRCDAAAKNCHSPQFLLLPSFRPSRPFVLLPSGGRRSIHWSDIPLRSREERCSVGVENRARARPHPRPSSGAQVAPAGGGRSRHLPLSYVWVEGRHRPRGSPHATSVKNRAAKEEEDLYAIRMRKAAASAASAKSVCLSPAA